MTGGPAVRGLGGRLGLIVLADTRLLVGRLGGRRAAFRGRITRQVSWNGVLPHHRPLR